MLDTRTRLKQLLLLVGDFCVLQITVPLMLLFRYGKITPENYDQHALPFLIMSGLWLIGFYVAGLYDLRLSRDVMKFLRTYFEGTIANLLLSLAFFYLLPVWGIAPRTNLFLYFVIVLFLDYLWRLAFNRLISKSIFRTRLLYIGSPQDAGALMSLIAEVAPGYELRVVLQTSPGSRFDDGSIVWCAEPQAICDIIRSGAIDTIVIGHKPEEVPGLQDALYETLFSTVTLMDRASFEEIATGRIPLEHISQSWFLSHIHEAEKVAYEGIKRFMDIVLAIPIALFTLIIFPFIALLVKISSKGPVLYSQIRTGHNQRNFRIYKFRTMRQNAEVAGIPQFAQKNDPRITPIGKFLRASRLDELPQIWNVIRGDMSLIGPRPERPEFVAELTRQMPYYTLRHITRPGLTGWAQVQFPYASTFEDNLKKLQYDLYYIKHRSLMLDISILLKTIRIVIKRMGT